MINFENEDSNTLDLNSSNTSNSAQSMAGDLVVTVIYANVSLIVIDIVFTGNNIKITICFLSSGEFAFKTAPIF